ncbi:MAG TPA: ArsB/NhaD family transporter, partial [Thermomicrobiales bacterium]|nr:ArsB/NhaD family transporter [Thermomicrobiales bacterium]
AWAALGGGTFLLAVGLAGRRVRAADAVRAISWPLFVFVVGMFLVVRGFEHVWLDQIRVASPADPQTALALAAAGNAVGSNLVNNVPMTLLSLSLIARTNGAAREALAYGTLIGANIGPTLTTFGSLATMLWLALIRKRGVDVSSLAYTRIALVTTPIVLLAATVALWLVLRWPSP